MPDPYLRNWLLDTGSLTERLQSLCRHFELHLLGQQTLTLQQDEAQLLQADPQGGDYQVREVLLCGEGQPWVFARSVIPQQWCQGELAQLGNKPLGKIIFNDDRFQRQPFDLCTVRAAELLSQLPHQTGNQQLWGRRSLFTYQGYKMIVAEVFLPASPAYQHLYPAGHHDFTT